MSPVNPSRGSGGTPIDLSGLGPGAIPPELTQYPAQQTERLVRDLEAALTQLEQFEAQNAPWLTDENLAEMNRIEAMMRAESAAIAAYGVGGAGSGTSAGFDEEIPQNLEPLWNGVAENGINQFPEDAGRMASDTARYGVYAGTIEIANSGSIANPSRTAFQMTEDMTALRGESRGRDIILTAEYQDGTKRSWIIKQGAVRAEPIIISAFGLSHAVTIDMRRVIRVSDGTNPAASQLYFQNIYIYGTAGDDTIFGSEGRDKIDGTAGNDTIYGMAGVDTIRGSAGNDTISGGAGEDILYGGGDFDTSFRSDEGETVAEFERGPLDDVVSELPPASSVFTSSDWVLADEQEPGMMTIENESARGGTIDLNMPAGYNMAYAERDASNSLVVTFVGDNGSFSVKIKNFFSEFDAASARDRIPILNFHGGAGNDIIDFSRVGMLDHQVINITDEAGGEDIILGAESEFVANGGSLDEMLRSQGNGNGDLQGFIDDGLFAPNNRERVTEEEAEHPERFGGYLATSNGDRQIEITADGTAERDPVLRIEAPDGYQQGYITQDEAGNYYVILMKPGVDGASAETIVIKVNASLTNTEPRLDMEHIRVGTRIANTSTDLDDENNRNFRMNWFELTPISVAEGDYLIDGGAGRDLIFGQEGSRIENASGDDVVERRSSMSSGGSVSLSDSETTPSSDRASGSERSGGSDRTRETDDESDAGDDDRDSDEDDDR